MKTLRLKQTEQWLGVSLDTLNFQEWNKPQLQHHEASPKNEMVFKHIALLKCSNRF